MLSVAVAICWGKAKLNTANTAISIPKIMRTVFTAVLTTNFSKNQPDTDETCGSS